VRISIDRLLLDGLPAGTSAEAIESALRRALAAQLAGCAPGRSAALPSVVLRGDGSSLDAAVGAVATAVAGSAGMTR
jgi:hypothetical protein